MISSVTLPFYPDIELHFTTLLVPELEHRLIVGQLDIAIITAPTETPRLTRIEIAKSILFLAKSVRDSLAQRYHSVLKDLNQRDCILFEKSVHPVVYESLFALARKEHVQFRQLQHVMTAEEAAQMLRDGRTALVRQRVPLLSEFARAYMKGLSSKPVSQLKLKLVG